MRRPGRFLAPLTAALALLAGLACPALADPLPHPLPEAAAALWHRAFAFQAHGDLPAALRLAARLDDTSPLGRELLGGLLAERYLGPDSHPDTAALRDWLERWPDLPDASAIYRLLLARLPDRAAAPPPPPAVAAIPPPATGAAEPDGPRRNRVLDQDVRDAARSHGEAGVTRLLAHTSGLDPAYAALLRGEAARILFTLNRDDDAFALAAGTLHDCAGHAVCARSGLAGFIGGLAAWRQEHIGLAGAMFAAGWRAETTTPELRAATAFWASRAAAIADDADADADAAHTWLLHAAEYPHSFYGLLARRRLGRRPAAAAAASADEAALVAGIAPGLRALALLEVGMPDRAAAELAQLWPAARQSRRLARAVMLVAGQAGLADTEARFADLLADGAAGDLTPLPKLPELRPAGGFRVDPAMVYGIARTESNFDTAMVSAAGAQGLLQIMPQTARDMLGRPLDGGALLHDPAFNLDLGQRYIAFLAEQDPINGNLIALLASYNAGLGTVARFAPLIRANGDPLLFIEAIPIDETRDYVPRVLRYTWIYAARLHLPAPSLDELAAGAWPRYHPRTPTTEAQAQTVARAQ